MMKHVLVSSRRWLPPAVKGAHGSRFRRPSGVFVRQIPLQLCKIPLKSIYKSHTLSSSASVGRPHGVHRPLASTLVAGSTANGHGLSGDICALRLSLLDIPGPLAEDLSDLLLAEGATSTAIEEHRPAGTPEQKIFADDPHSSATPPQSSLRVWDRCTVIAYFSGDDSNQANAAADQAMACMGLNKIKKDIQGVTSLDWEASIRDSYRPVEVCPGLWIVPTWSTAPDTTATNVILEPGLAFGTGDHPTTRLCLRWLSALQKQTTCSLLDYGTGSGVLAIAAVRLGVAAKAVGTDIEGLAVKASAQNAAANDLQNAFLPVLCTPASGNLNVRGDVPDDWRPPYRIVVANILAGPLVDLAPTFARYSEPDGFLGLSGILESQAPEVIGAYEPWYQGFEVISEEGWALVTARRKPL